MSTRVGGSPSPPPQIETPKTTETTSKTEPKAPAEPKSTKQETEAKPISPQHKNAQLAEYSMAGQMRAVQLNIKTPAPTTDGKAPTLSSGVSVKGSDGTSGVAGKTAGKTEESKSLSLGDKGPAVENAQKELNKWRAENGRKPIKEDGNFNNEMETAVLDFQKANGLNPDCIVGANVKDRLALENDPKFKALNNDTKKQVREQMNGYSKNPAARQNLRDLATDSNFGKLSRAGQDGALKALATSPESPGNLKNIKENVKDRLALEGNPNFKKLPEATQKQVFETMERYAFEPGQRANLMKIATDPGMTKMSPAHQEHVLKTLARNPADAVYANHLKQIIGGQSFEKMDDSIKTRVLNLYGDHVSNPRYNEHLTNLVSHRNFGAMSLQQETKTLNLFESTSMDGKAALAEISKKTINGSPALMSKSLGGGGALIDQLDRLNTMNLSPRIVDGSGRPADKGRVVEDLLKELANPHRNIDQHNRNTCTCTSMTFNLALTNPAEYARVVTDLSTNGVAMLAGGVMIAPPAGAFRQDSSTRSVGERLFQSSLMNYAYGGKYQNLTSDGGLDLDQQISVLQALNGKSYKSVPNLVVPAFPGVQMDDNAPGRTKKELDAGRGPVYARLRWGSGGHAVEITKIENGRVYFRNPWGGNNPGVTPGVGTDYQREKPPRRVEDSVNGIESMSERDYANYLKSIIVEG